MNATLVRGTVWPMGSKPIEAGAQPCTDTWKIEPKYTDPGILIDNWYEQREQYRVSLLALAIYPCLRNGEEHSGTKNTLFRVEINNYSKLHLLNIIWDHINDILVLFVRLREKPPHSLIYGVRELFIRHLQRCNHPPVLTGFLI